MKTLTVFVKKMFLIQYFIYICSLRRGNLKNIFNNPFYLVIPRHQVERVFKFKTHESII